MHENFWFYNFVLWKETILFTLSGPTHLCSWAHTASITCWCWSDLRTLLIHQFISITDSTLVCIIITLKYPYSSELLDLPSWPSMALFTGIHKDASKSLCTLSQGNDLISFARHVAQITDRRVIYSQLLWRRSEASLSRCADAKTRTVPPSSPSTRLSITSFSGGLKSNSWCAYGGAR